MLKCLTYGVCGVSVAWGALDLIGYTVNQVTGRSMQPTLNPDCYDDSLGRSQMLRCLDWVLIKKSNGNNVTEGDIVTIHNPLAPNDRDIKRIIATENTMIWTKSYKNRITIVPKGHLWLEGDNQRISKDSNCYGPVPASLVFGKAVAIVFPPWRWQLLKADIPWSSHHKIYASISSYAEVDDEDS